MAIKWFWCYWPFLAELHMWEESHKYFIRFLPWFWYSHVDLWLTNFSAVFFYQYRNWIKFLLTCCSRHTKEFANGQMEKNLKDVSHVPWWKCHWTNVRWTECLLACFVALLWVSVSASDLFVFVFGGTNWVSGSLMLRGQAEDNCGCGSILWWISLLNLLVENF